MAKKKNQRASANRRQQKLARRKKRQHSNAPRVQHTKPDVDPQAARMDMERSLRGVNKLLEGQDFDSVDEINAFLQSQLVGGKAPEFVPETPEEEAQEIMYEAWQTEDPRQRVALARQAIEIDADCVDAYVLLAEETAGSVADAKKLYADGVRAGERALGADFFEENEGHFWGITETRPYMRARMGLADCCWSLGQHADAIEHYQEMLRLNPGDNQGVRYLLLTCLLESKEDDKAKELLDQFDDDAMASWHYSRALWTFRQFGDREIARDELATALEQNSFVPAYLLGEKGLPRQRPEYIEWGGESEAVEYAASAIQLWKETPGALKWLSDNL
ncbi:MAG: tetratricopeptide repeat protein [Chloroflexota bacterium]